jgi:hypothetical protein
MKYIKLFENRNQDEINSLKDFIIVSIDTNKNDLLIAEVTNRSPFTISYKYDFYNNTLTKHYNINGAKKFFEVPERYYNEWLYGKIIYQADTLQDAIDMLPVLNATTKYNL